ncbi:MULTISPECIES: hypothetical protein [unclassified Amycolatopsis]|nr:MULTISPECIES: hypothetical protein [unclassified Amycolatopsis]
MSAIDLTGRGRVLVSPDEVGGPRINVYSGTRSHLVDTLAELA